MFSITGIIALITGLAGPLASAYAKTKDLEMARIAAGTETEKAAFDAQIALSHDRAQVIVAEAGSRLNAIIRGALAFGPMVYLNKLYVWDKVIGSFAGYTQDIFTTDPLDEKLWTVVTVVLSFYFMSDMVSTARSWFGRSK